MVFFSHIIVRKTDQGFTLVELLVSIMLVGILTAIALPSLSNQANKAKQAGAKQYIAALNKAQQAYYTQNSSFITDAGNVAQLGAGIPTTTKDYIYTFANAAGAGGSLAGVSIVTTVNPNSPLKNYGGMVSAIPVIVGGADASSVVTYSGLCEANEAGATGDGSVAEIDATGAVTCTAGIALGSKP